MFSAVDYLQFSSVISSILAHLNIFLTTVVISKLTTACLNTRYMKEGMEEKDGEEWNNVAPLKKFLSLNTYGILSRVYYRKQSCRGVIGRGEMKS